MAHVSVLMAHDQRATAFHFLMVKRFPAFLLPWTEVDQRRVGVGGWEIGRAHV